MITRKITREDCRKLYLVALTEIEKACEQKLYFSEKNSCGGTIVDKMFIKAKELNL